VNPSPARRDRAAAFRIIFIYASFAMAWIYLSDHVLEYLAPDRQTIVRFAVYKGFLFVAVTAALLYQQITRYLHTIRETEEKLLASRKLLQSLVEGTSDAVYAKTREGRYILFNQAAAGMTGKSPEETLGRDDTSLFPPDEAAHLMAADRAVMENGELRTWEERLTLADGQVHTLLATKGPLRDASGEVTGLFGIARDITERTRIEEALRESLERTRQIVNGAGEGVVVHGPDMRYEVWNPYMERLTGKKASEVLGRHPLELFPQLYETGVVDRIERALRGEDPPSLDYRREDPDSGRSVWVSQTLAPLRNTRGDVVGAIAVVQDITYRKQLEEQLVQTQKMEAIGQLAGGVAHDFNNILTVIYGYASMIRFGMKGETRWRDEIEQVIAASERASRLTRSLLAFSRRQVMNPVALDLNELVRQVEGMLVRIIGEDIRLETELAPGPVGIVADAGQVEQVLMNLATNARDAMSSGGRLAIGTSWAEIPPDGSRDEGGGRAPGRYAVLSVSDSGHGMDPDTATRIFEPFFTTKEVGKGTGLGLSIVYGIARQHGGFVEVDSEPGRGSTFRVHFPAAAEGEGRQETREGAEAVGAGTETLMVVEDDEAIRKFMKLVLEEFGYTVIVAVNGDEAIERFKAGGERIDGVLLDMIMPGKSGVETWEAIRRIAPRVKALFVSGYSPDMLEARGLTLHGVEIVQKPVHPVALVRKLRDLLDGRGAAEPNRDY
jgi:PAS domain S-box-containing protein